jgi:hypothetical protein
MKTMFQTPKMRLLVFAIASCCLFMFNSCEKNEVTSQEEEVAVNKPMSDLERQMIDAMAPEKKAIYLEQRKTKATTLNRPVASNGLLCPDEPVVDEAVARTYSSNLGDADYWTFYGVAGASVTVDVSRITCGMDPYAAVFEGIVTDSDDVNFFDSLARGDDNVITGCCWGDPNFSLVLPSTGYYTVVVADWLSCEPAPLFYQITLSGNICDSDGDGCNDDVDPHPNSDQSATVIIDGCDSGVANTFPVACSTMSDLIADCAASATNHGEFVSCVSHLTNEWKAAGLITGREKGKIQSCAGRSSIP